MNAFGITGHFATNNTSGIGIVFGAADTPYGVCVQSFYFQRARRWAIMRTRAMVKLFGLSVHSYSYPFIWASQVGGTQTLLKYRDSQFKLVHLAAHDMLRANVASLHYRREYPSLRTSQNQLHTLR